MGKLTITSVFVRMQLESILTRAVIGAVCVDATMITAAIAWLTFVDIWKDSIKQDNINLIVNQP